VLAALVLISLALITVSVREADHGVAAERVARPFRDVYGYFGGLVSAKDENKKLRAEVEKLRHQMIADANAARDAAQLRAMLRYQDSAQFPADYKPVNARVISFPGGPFQQQVAIAAGSSSGIRLHTPVVSIYGDLIGEVTRVASRASQVTLLTDPNSAVSAYDEKTGVLGLLQHGAGNTLMLDRVTKDKVVAVGDIIVTAGTRNARYPDLYPRGIPIGVVTGFHQNDTDLFKQVQVAPYVDFTSLDSVAALVTTKPPPVVP
jgi:rod shape-determining protein MreC